MQNSVLLRAGTAMAAGMLLMAATLPVQAGVADEGWHVGISGIFGDYELDSGEISDNTAGVQGHVQYRFNRTFALEGTYFTLGDFEQDDTVSGTPGTIPESLAKIGINGFTAGIVGYAPLPSTNFQLFGKVGFYRVNQDLEIDGVDSGSRDSDGLTLGVGAEIAMSEQWGLRLDGNMFDLDGADFWTAGLGVTYQFGTPGK